MDTITLLVGALGGLIAGVIIGRVILKKAFSSEEQKIKEKSDILLKEAELQAETIKKDKIIEAKEQLLKLKTEFEEEANRKKNQIINNENRLRQKEQHFSKQIEQNKRKEAELDSMKENLTAQLEIMSKRKSDLDKIKQEQVNALEKIANLSADEAEDQLVKALQDEAQTKASSYIKEIMEEAKMTATKQSKKVVIETIQRTATENAIENCVSVFNIESDDVKGKIIGREGRNIRALEAATGIEIIVDDTPEAIIISGFDPVRREIARLSLHRLVTDGRIHPARIEEVVGKTKKNIDEEIIEIGEKTII
ncbi:MAG: DUF3552 domain-containing protein, partial [Cyclobacteriaceae bacterium]|nr:DUF3552 domain-containing protein [Cyclobacteriaceae bacterium]